MPNAKTRYYTTDDTYRPTASNHIMGVDYDEDSMVLYMSFYNGAKYKYYGVPKGLYDGLMASTGSHGTFFWENIRPRFDGILIPNIEPEDNHETIADYPELDKLNSLDTYERYLKRQLRLGAVSPSQYSQVVIKITQERDRLTSLLESKGYFDEQEEVEIPKPAPTKVIRKASKPVIDWDGLAVIAETLLSGVFQVVGWILAGVVMLLVSLNVSPRH